MTKLETKSGPPAPSVRAAADVEKLAFSVVGIGASAGGLEAFAQLLSNLRVDTGMAFVLVQHLDPNHESMLRDILARSTTMPVSVVEDGTRIEPDHVYVIPPNTKMTIAESRLKLVPRQKSEEGLFPIDHFFSSLAREQGAKAVGIVLSGTGSDGAKGLAEIATEGGVTFAQDKSAKFDGMPMAAASHGVDFILPPERIAQQLGDLAKVPADAVGAFDDSAADFQKILQLLATARSIDFAQYKRPTVQRRILRRMAMHQITTVAAYHKFLKANASEIDSLYEDILIKVTEFFRAPESFEALKKYVFPAILRRKPKPASVRVWVAGCATGEEAYSIAICLLEAMDDTGVAIKIEIFATDISETALATARAGYYDETRMQNVSAERLRRFFVKEGRGYRVSSAIREPCIFARQNVVRDPPFSKMDLISCRNLLIYLSPVLQERAFLAFHFALNPGCFLALGSAESLGAAADLFDVTDKNGKIFVSKRSARTGRLTSFSMDALSDKIPTGHLTPASRSDITSKADIRSDADRAILAQHAPSGVVINDHMDVIQFRGDTSAYLIHPPGDVTTNLFKMCREGLLVEVRAALHEAKATNHAVKKTAWLRTPKQDSVSVTVNAIPFSDSAAGQMHFVVLFAPGAPAGNAPRDRTADEDHDVARLERELGETKEYLNAIIEKEQAANEELKSASEEILSANEELQSTNEEMATAKEEVQATNEELTTVNDELQERFREINRVNSDLTNLFGAANTPIVMVAENLTIRRLTSAAEKALNLTEIDIGSTLNDVAAKLRIDGLAQLTTEVIQSLNTDEREIQDRNGHWYALRIKPYRTSDNKIDGAVLAMGDIDPLKKSFERLTEAHEFSKAIIETAPVPLLVLDGDLRVITASEAFCRLFQVSMYEINNVKIYDLGKGYWNTPKLRALLEEILPKNERLENFIVDHDFPELGRRIMRLNARRLIQKSDRAERILLAIDDVTEEKQTEERTASAKDAAEAANRAKSDFLANMSHEIRTPLSAILGYSELLANPDQTKLDALNCTSRIQKNIEHLTELIDEILDISKIEAGKLEVNLEKFLLVPELRETFSLLHDRAKSRGIEFFVTFEGPIPESITTCPMRLRQILLNIVGNAIKFTAKGRVSVIVKLSKTKLLTFVIKDTGTGLSNDQQTRLFQPFTQADSSVTRKFGGTGLGLILARRLAEALGGDVGLTESEVGKGSTFTLCLNPGPLDGVPMLTGLTQDDLQIIQDVPVDRFSKNRRLEGLNILLAEDGMDNQILLTHILAESGATVAVAKNGAEAVTMALASHYDLIVMDMQMPILDGYEAVRQLIQKKYTSPIVALTANAMRGEREICLTAGCVDFVTKPVKANTLVDVVAKFTNERPNAT